MEALRASLAKTESARSQVTRLGPRKAPKRVEEPAKVTRKASKRKRLKQRDADEGSGCVLTVCGRGTGPAACPDTTRSLIRAGFVHPRGVRGASTASRSRI